MNRATEIELMRLLHGELPAEQAGALRARMAREPELAAAWARLEGAWVCPEGAACFAAAARLRAAGWLSESDEVVVLSTGAGLKYPETVPADLPLIPKGGAIPLAG